VRDVDVPAPVGRHPGGVVEFAVPRARLDAHFSRNVPHGGAVAQGVLEALIVFCLGRVVG